MDDSRFTDFEKLADICRKKGIKKFKNAQFEFELDAEAPESAYKKRLKEKEFEKSKIDPVVEADKELFWSTNLEAQG